MQNFVCQLLPEDKISAKAMIKQAIFHPRCPLGPPNEILSWENKRPTWPVINIRCGARKIKHQLSSRGQHIALDSTGSGQNRYQARPELFADESYTPKANDSTNTILFLDGAGYLQHLKYGRQAIERILKPRALSNDSAAP